MKRILTVLFLMITIYGFGQVPSNYLNIRSRYNLIAVKADSGIHIPGYNGTPVIRGGVWSGAGNIAVDTTNNKFFFYSGGQWREAGSSSGNYGNVQLNRNGQFAGTDSLKFDAGVLTVNGIAFNVGKINSTLFAIGTGAGTGATSASYSNFLGASAGDGATNASNSNFLGNSAGSGATGAYQSNLLGVSAGESAINASNSNFLGYSAGIGATNASNSNFLGYFAGYAATNASYSNLFGYNVGKTFASNNIGSNNIVIGTNISLPDTYSNRLNLGGVLFGKNTYATTTGNPSITAVSTGKIGIGVVDPDSTLHVNGSFKLVNGTQGTGKVLTSDANGGASWKTPANSLTVGDLDGASSTDGASIINDTLYMQLFGSEVPGLVPSSPMNITHYLRADGNWVEPSIIDSIWRVVGKDSIFWRRNNITYALKDSTGGGSSGLTIGTTTITGSATGSILYDSVGVLRRNDKLFWDRTSNVLRIGGTLSENPTIKFTSTDNSFSTDFSIYRRPNASPSPRGLTFYNDGSGDVMTLARPGKVGILTTDPTSSLTVAGSFEVGYAAKSADYTLTDTDCVIEVTATGKTLTLPTAVGCSGRQYTIKLTASGTGTVATTSSQTIDGSTTYSLSAQYKYVTVVSNNANWIITANN